MNARTLVPVLALVVAALATPACASTSKLDGRFCEKTAATFGEVGQVPRWTLGDGEDVVLVAFTGESSDRKLNEELLVQVAPATLAPGTYPLEKVARQAYYQRGGQVLTFASRALTGTLEIKERKDDAVSGRVDLTAKDPEVDTLGDKTVHRAFDFALRKGDNPGFCR